MRKNRVVEQNRCYHLVSRLAHRAFFLDDDFDEPKVGPLSRREIEVLTYIAQGKTHEEIGIIGDISAETVRTHMKSIFRKLDCANAPAAVSRAYELGILRA